MREEQEGDRNKAPERERKPKRPRQIVRALKAGNAKYPAGKYERLCRKCTIDGIVRAGAQYKEPEHSVKECDPDLA
jgi:hypothetical protein